MFIFKNKFEHPVIVTIEILKQLKVKVTKSTVNEIVVNHPDYPSLLSISDTLARYRIDNLSLKTDTEGLGKLPLPLIAVIKDESRSYDLFAVVKEVSNEHVIYYNSEKHCWQNMEKNIFIERWQSQIALIADAENAVDENDFYKKLKDEKRHNFIRNATWLFLPVLTLLACALLIFEVGFSSLKEILFTIITMAGCITAVLLIWYEIDEYNPALQQICSAGKKINCGAILNSKASKIAGISWSTIGFTYFLGGLLILLFTGINNPSFLFILSWLNVLAAPYIIFSIYYQWRIARQWCVLCLLVQAILASQLIITLMAGWHYAVPFQSILSYNILLPVLLAYSIPFIMVSILLPAYRLAKESKNNNHKLQRLKHNRQIFEALLSKQKILECSTKDLGIVLGDPLAKNKIVKVCNPYCGPCAKAHKPMEELLNNNDDVQIQIVFTATGEENDIRTPPVRHLLAIAENEGQENIQHALDDWYFADRKDYETFAAKYPMNGELKMQDNKIKAMHEWCNKTGITATPTFFINGFQMPEIYTVDDLKYFLSA